MFSRFFIYFKLQTFAKTLLAKLQHSNNSELVLRYSSLRQIVTKPLNWSFFLSNPKLKHFAKWSMIFHLCKTTCMLNNLLKSLSKRNIFSLVKTQTVTLKQKALYICTFWKTWPRRNGPWKSKKAQNTQELHKYVLVMVHFNSSFRVSFWELEVQRIHWCKWRCV